MITEMIGRELRWVQPSAWKMQYELRADEEIIATLRFRSSFGTFATAESADGCWTFKRIGFWQTKATIRVCGSDTEIASFKNNTWSGGGTLELSDGRQFTATTKLWRINLEFKSETGETLVSFKSGGFVHLSATVEIQPNAAEMSELPWIVMLGWYLTVMMYMDSAATAGVS
ncbi:MAG: hypothetical protein ND895_04910 [Pyrinomonadaceae bacterium]|nr:hypothetical protein [Pyrinomonadaceae bacterium]